MRIAVFTGDPGLERSTWWPIVLATPGLTEVIVCRQIVSRRPRDVLRRLRRNVAKHGLIFIPYRIGALIGSIVRRVGASAHAQPVPQAPLPVETLESLDLHAPPVLQRLGEWQPDLGLSIGAPILRPALFQIPKLGTLNLHLGRVPEFRGAPPGFWELYTGARTIGATVHWIDAGLDTGAVVAAGEAPIYATDTLARVETRAHELGGHVLTAALRQVAAGGRVGAPQPAGGHTFRAPTLRQRAILAGRLAVRRWGRRLRDPRGILRTIALLAWLGLYRPARDLVRSLRRRHPVRVFTFHRVTDLCRDAMTVAPDVFQQQMAYVCRHHEVVSLDHALEVLRSGTRLHRPLAVLAFDDGYQSVWDAARPLLARQGLPASVFVCTGLVGTDQRLPHDDGNTVRPYLGLMAWDELRSLRDAGWTIGAHTVSHARLARCSGDALRREVTEPAAAIRSQLGQRAVALAYPFGGREDISADGRLLVREAGHAACLSNYGGENHAPADLMDVRRIDIGGDYGDLVWKAWVHGRDHARWRLWWARVLASGASHQPEPV